MDGVQGKSPTTYPIEFSIDRDFPVEYGETLTVAVRL